MHGRDDGDEAAGPSFPFAADRRIASESSTIRFRPGLHLLCVRRGELRLRESDPLSSPGRIVVLQTSGTAALSASAGTDAIRLPFQQEFLGQLSIGLCDGSLPARFFPGPGGAGSGVVGFLPDAGGYAERHGLFQATLTECRAAKRGWRRMVRFKVLEILLLLDRLPAEQRWCADRTEIADGGGERACIEEIKRAIQSNYTEDFTLQGMARRCGLNSSYFSRLFRENAGIPPFEYIDRIRVQKACLLLKRTDLTILEVALSVGYNNVSFFNRYFRKVMKTSPREYWKYVQG